MNQPISPTTIFNAALREWCGPAGSLSERQIQLLRGTSEQVYAEYFSRQVAEYREKAANIRAYDYHAFN